MSVYKKVLKDIRDPGTMNQIGRHWKISSRRSDNSVIVFIIEEVMEAWFNLLTRCDLDLLNQRMVMNGVELTFDDADGLRDGANLTSFEGTRGDVMTNPVPETIGGARVDLLITLSPERCKWKEIISQIFPEHVAVIETHEERGDDGTDVDEALSEHEAQVATPPQAAKSKDSNRTTGRKEPRAEEERKQIPSTSKGIKRERHSFASPIPVGTIPPQVPEFPVRNNDPDQPMHSTPKSDSSVEYAGSFPTTPVTKRLVKKDIEEYQKKFSQDGAAYQDAEDSLPIPSSLLKKAREEKLKPKTTRVEVVYAGQNSSEESSHEEAPQEEKEESTPPLVVDSQEAFDDDPALVKACASAQSNPIASTSHQATANRGQEPEQKRSASPQSPSASGARKKAKPQEEYRSPAAIPSDEEAGQEASSDSDEEPELDPLSQLAREQREPSASRSEAAAPAQPSVSHKSRPHDEQLHRYHGRDLRPICNMIRPTEHKDLGGKKAPNRRAKEQSRDICTHVVCRELYQSKMLDQLVNISQLHGGRMRQRVDGVEDVWLIRGGSNHFFFGSVAGKALEVVDTQDVKFNRQTVAYEQTELGDQFIQRIRVLERGALQNAGALRNFPDFCNDENFCPMIGYRFSGMSGKPRVKVEKIHPLNTQLAARVAAYADVETCGNYLLTHEEAFGKLETTFLIIPDVKAVIGGQRKDVRTIHFGDLSEELLKTGNRVRLVSKRRRNTTGGSE